MQSTGINQLLQSQIPKSSTMIPQVLDKHALKKKANGSAKDISEYGA